ncbi:MAG TPA: cytochrome c [Terriglobia bacterium]|jgi:mono/diheme cytochrome c family protein
MKLWKQGCIFAGLFLCSLLLAGAAPQAEPAAAAGDAAKGKQVFQDNCSLCHSAETDEMIVGPGLKGLFKWPPHKLSDGTEHKEHTDEIIRKQIVEGGGAMAPMGEVVSAEQVNDLIAYLKTL